MEIPVQRYQRGGDIYERLVQSYGVAGADRIAYAATLGRDALAEAIAYERSGPAATNTSTLGNFFYQITTDPLAAPLDAANSQIGKAVWNVIKNPFVLLTVGVLVFWAVGGFTWVKGKLK